MSKEYHINVNGKSIGVYTLEQLKEVKINPDAIVWYNGLSDWLPVSEVAELQDFIAVAPPPIPKSANKKIVHAPGYLVMGIIGLALTVLLQRSNLLFASSYDHPVLISFIFLGFRFIMASIVAGTLKEYKRPHFGWGVFAFFLPSISFICVAFVSPKDKNVKSVWYEKSE